MPPIFGMNESEAITENAMEPLVEMPPLVNAKKLTTVVWSVIFGTVLYILLRLIITKTNCSSITTIYEKSELSIYWMRSVIVRY